jgi:hypothetical protein
MSEAGARAGGGRRAAVSRGFGDPTWIQYEKRVVLCPKACAWYGWSGHQHRLLREQNKLVLKGGSATGYRSDQRISSVR